MKWIKKIDSDVFEIRSKASSIIQRALYFHVSGNRYVINHGFTKKTQNTPASEIDHAKMLKKNSTRIINMAAIILMIIWVLDCRAQILKEEFLKENAVLESALAVYQARQNAGWTQRELAQFSKVPQSAIARIERGDNTRIDTVSKITVSLGKHLTISIQ